jgi:NADPH:quinone reductase-like Zn-dependent oxidoreductase
VNGAGGATGRLIVSMAALRGVDVIATAGPRSYPRVIGAGARTVVDYHDPRWADEVVEATGGRGVDAAVNAALNGAAAALAAVRDGGRLVTITSDPPEGERGIEVVSLYVRPDGEQLELAGQDLASGRLDFGLVASFPLADAGAALGRAIAAGGPIALEV